MTVKPIFRLLSSALLLLFACAGQASLPMPPGYKPVLLQNNRNGSIYTVLPTRKVFSEEKFSEDDFDLERPPDLLAGVAGEKRTVPKLFSIPGKTSTTCEPSFSICRAVKTL